MEGRDLRRWRCSSPQSPSTGTSCSPSSTFYIYWSQIPYFILFTAFAALVSWLGTVRQRVEADLRQSRDLLREQASILSPALRLALIYAFFGALWILVSDRLSFYLVPDLQLAERLQTYKGWFFIAVTSVLLWLLANTVPQPSSCGGGGVASFESRIASDQQLQPDPPARHR